MFSKDRLVTTGKTMKRRVGEGFFRIGMASVMAGCVAPGLGSKTVRQEIENQEAGVVAQVQVNRTDGSHIIDVYEGWCPEGIPVAAYGRNFSTGEVDWAADLKNGEGDGIVEVEDGDGQVDVLCGTEEGAPAASFREQDLPAGGRTELR